MDMNIKVKCNYLGAIIISTLDLRILHTIAGMYTWYWNTKTPADYTTTISIYLHFYLLTADENTIDATQQSSSRWEWDKGNTQS